MSRDEFTEYVDKEGWSDAESEASTEECRLDFSKLNFCFS